ncbi:MAG TPA: imidazoleglycerol-phosphate dehydratase HisB [Candidatus Baltobacteraceae bacterium]|nr:imidazoleglycerol-phosphate dehydratase HisB [Candidatus Baltobacteraceae bacterium]
MSLRKVVSIVRRAHVARTTKETSIELTLYLDGGPTAIVTDVKFFDHMLEAFAKHSGCGLELRASGDGMDHHHLIEDVGITLGRAIAEALGEKRGITRFGSQTVPLDDALVLGSIDLSGRAYLNFSVDFGVERVGGDLPAELIPHFFHSLCEHGRFNLHLLQLAGTNSHHLCEATFKAFARAFSQAKSRTEEHDVPSTKGMLE